MARTDEVGAIYGQGFQPVAMLPWFVWISRKAEKAVGVANSKLGSTKSKKASWLFERLCSEDRPYCMSIPIVIIFG